MDVGKMDRLVTLQDVTETQDDEGGISKAWSTGTQMFAQVTELTGKEKIMNNAVTADQSLIFKIHFSTSHTPTTKSRIVYDSVNYNITSVREIGRGEAYEIMGRSDV